MAGTEEILSQEDVDWLDSCLDRDADIVGKNWDAVKDALLDLISSGQNSSSSSASEIDSCRSEMDTGPSPLSEEALSFELTQRGTHLILSDGEENDGGDFPFHVESSSPTNFKNVFQPNYKEFLGDSSIQDQELSLDDNVSQFSHEDIFKVWDLDVPNEEGEFISQLKKALEPTSPQEPQEQESLPESDDQGNLRELLRDFTNVDDLVSGTADLSL